MCRTPPPPSPAESFNWSDDDEDDLSDPRDLLKSIPIKLTSKTPTCSTPLDKSSSTRASPTVNSNRVEIDTPDIHSSETDDSLSEPIFPGSYPSLANAGNGEATISDQVNEPIESPEDADTESDQVNEPIQSPEDVDTGSDQVNEPIQSPRKEPKIVIFTSDEESDTEPKPVIHKTQPPTEEIKERLVPKVRRRRKSALSSDSSGSEDEYVSAVSTRRDEDEIVLTSDEESPVARGIETRKTRQPKGSKIGQNFNSRNKLADLFAKTSISDIPSKKKEKELVFFTSDDDSSPDVRNENPQKRWSGKSGSQKVSGSYDDIFSEESELEGTASDDLSKGTIAPKLIPSTHFHETAPKTPSRGGIKFKSPEKKVPRIPPTPYRPDSAEFWDQSVINDWNDQHSPRKVPLQLLTNLNGAIVVSSGSECGSDTDYESMDDFIDDGDDAPRTVSKTNKNVKTPGKTPGKTVSERQAKKEWDARKTSLAESFIKLLDKELNDGGVAKYYEDRGGIKLVWNSNFRRTAGRARLVKGTIELSNKVITNEDRLYNTTAHEYCHLAVWAISREKRDTHGPVFKQWGARVSARFSQYNINVTTLHIYEIDYKFKFLCQSPGCHYAWQQHSKPKGIDNKRCPWCKVGTLLQVKPPLRPPTEYQLYTKAHMARIKKENPGSPHKEVMTILGQEWKKYKAQTPPRVVRDKSRIDLEDMPDTMTASKVKMQGLSDVEAVVEEDRSRATLGDLMNNLKL
ncbi:SprT-like family-domain-containing protein [Trichophaea hybrida]|nr:SprT-like family-domain-containing protein [Trichophaea hybrida]